MTTSTSTPRRSSSGRTAAQLPTTPTDSARFSPARCGDQRDRLVEARRDPVEVALADPPVQAVAVDVDDQARAAVERHRERLRAAHPAAAAGHGQRAGERPAEPLRGDRGERLVGALQDPLRADVDPRARGHLPVHGQAELLEPAELGPGRPVADEVRVGDQHARRPLVRPQHADRLARLDQQRLVVAERGQRPHDGVVRVPRPGGLARCRRRRPGRRGARPPRGRGCS